MSKIVLLDECTPEKFALYLKGYEVKLAKDVGLSGIHDTAVNRKASEKGFDVVLTTEQDIHKDIVDEKRFQVGIIVLKMDKRVAPTRENIKHFAPQTKVAIELAKKGEMYHVHSSGQIERVTCEQLRERDKKEEQQQATERTLKEREKREDFKRWEKQRPEGVSVQQWRREYGEQKREQDRQRRAEREQEQIYRRR